MFFIFLAYFTLYNGLQFRPIWFLCLLWDLYAHSCLGSAQNVEIKYVVFNKKLAGRGRHCLGHV